MPFPTTGQYGLVSDATYGLIVHPKIPGLIRDLRKLDAQSILDSIGPVASDIIQAWRLSKEASAAPPVSQTTVMRYRYVARTLEEKYSREQGVELNTLSPVHILQHLLAHSRELKKASWMGYRSALLFHNHDRVTYFEQRNAPASDYSSYRRALAALIVIQRPPLQQAAANHRAHERSKIMGRTRYEQLVTSLARPRTKKAQDFVIATMVAGLRPGEWANASLRPAEARDMTTDESPSKWSVLTTRTSKRKGDLAFETRSLLLRHGVDYSLVVSHMNNFAAALAKTQTKGGRPLAADGGARFINHTSDVVKKACRRLWPEKPEHWATLYILRSQARANFTKLYGVEIAAAMLGHAPRTGQGFYAPKRAGSVGNRDPLVFPGKDVLERAAKMPRSRPRPDLTVRDDDVESETEEA